MMLLCAFATMLLLMWQWLLLLLLLMMMIFKALLLPRPRNPYTPNRQTLNLHSIGLLN